MNDVEFKITLVCYEEDLQNETIKEMSYIINDACSQLEQLKCYISYKVKVNGSAVVIED